MNNDDVLRRQRYALQILDSGSADLLALFCKKGHRIFLECQVQFRISLQAWQTLLSYPG